MGCPKCGFSHPPDGVCMEPMGHVKESDELSDAERERIEMLAEEAAEVVQVCMKILRHGLLSYHPEDENKTSNRRLLERELLDLWTVYEQCVFAGELNRINFYGSADVWNRKLKWTHHQGRTRRAP